MAIQRMTPDIFVERIEPCLPFWTERLGFEIPVRVPAASGDGDQFVILVQGEHQLMYQTFASAEEDIPGLVAPADPGNATLFVTVGDLADVKARMDGLEPVMAERRTFYGATEIAYRNVCGTVVVFAEFDEEAGGG